MIFIETKLKDTFIVELERKEDDRGFFARTWCQREFEQHGLNPHLAQCSLSYNAKKGTLRGMHYQCSPHAEAKLVRCTQGAMYDVILDLRPESPTFRRWIAVELTEVNRKAIYIPEGCAHGFQALADATEVLYQMSEFFHPEHARGVRWDDPAFKISWPPGPRIISPKDQQYQDFTV